MSIKEEVQSQIAASQKFLVEYRADFSKFQAAFSQYVKTNNLVYASLDEYMAGAYEYLRWLEELIKEDEKELLEGLE